MNQGKLIGILVLICASLSLTAFPEMREIILKPGESQDVLLSKVSCIRTGPKKFPKIMYHCEHQFKLDDTKNEVWYSWFNSKTGLVEKRRMNFSWSKDITCSQLEQQIGKCTTADYQWFHWCGYYHYIPGYPGTDKYGYAWVMKTRSLNEYTMDAHKSGGSHPFGEDSSERFSSQEECLNRLKKTVQLCQ